MANEVAQFVVNTYKADLGGLPKTDALLYWTGKIQSGEMTEAEVKAAIQESPEGIAYAETGEVDPARAAVTGTSADFAGEEGGAENAETNNNNQQVTTTDNNTQQITTADIQQLYRQYLGGEGQSEYVQTWADAVNSGQMTYEEAAQAIQNSPEGQAYAASIDPATGLGTVSPERAAFLATQTGATVGNLPEGFDGNTNTVATTAGTTGNFSPLIQQYYQELFNRQAQQPGLDYFSGRLGSGDLTEDTLRDAIIAGAQGSDRLYYDASQQGGPVFDATQALFGRRPARGRFNPETGQLEGGFGQYRSQLDAGNLTPEQLRRNLVDLAYRRGEGGGRSGDYQYYLDTLGIDRSGNPFLQDDGTYANIAYGADLSQYQQDPGMPPPPPGGGGMPPMPPGFPGGGFPGGGFPGGGMPGKGGRIPGQYITGNQLYSGLPFGMTQPMGMMNFMQPMMQPTIYQPPQLSQQYMPNRGLMSGYSTGFGPYGGFRRPRFGGGKGGPIYRPMGVGKGGFGF
jgi:hypothetical protein